MSDQQNHPAELEFLLNHGAEAASRGDKEAARESFRRATALDPDNLTAWLSLGDLAGTLTEKRRCYQRVLQLDPNHAHAKAALRTVEDQLAGRSPQPIAKQPETLDEPYIPAPAGEIAACYRHPQRETGLRCIQCGRFICAQCAHQTPVGQVCPICRKERRSPQYKLEPLDAVKGLIAAAIVGAAVTYAAQYLGGGFFMIYLLFLIGPAVGELLMRIIQFATNKRGPLMQGAVLGGMLLGAAGVWIAIGGGDLLMTGIFLGLAIAFAIGRLR